MAGFLVPPHYKVVAPELNDLLIASIIWGFTLASGLFSSAKATKQTAAIWKRSRRLHPYVIMVWAEWTVSMVIGVLSWVFLRGFIEPSFWIYFAFLCLWVVQIQCLMGIIINRIALLMVHQQKAVKIKWGAAFILGLVNISVFCIWIPAQLQISETYININHIWDRIEKVIFLLVDASLNLYFIYLVRSKLIANGLTKYMPLFKFNLFMVGVSMSLDIILIGSMSFPNGFIYVQFHPLVYILKLHIEMNIADLIVKVVRATGDHGSYAQGTELPTRQGSAFLEGTGSKQATTHATDPFAVNEAHIEASSREPVGRPSGGITKMVSTTVISRRFDDDRNSSSSTRELKNGDLTD